MSEYLHVERSFLDQLAMLGVRHNLPVVRVHGETSPHDFTVYRIGVLQRQALQIDQFANQRFTKIYICKPRVYYSV
jgi:hypothetical protein